MMWWAFKDTSALIWWAQAELSQTVAQCTALWRRTGENKTFYLLLFQGNPVKTKEKWLYFWIVMYDKALCLCISFPVCLWRNVCGHTLHECACVFVCLSFVFNTLLTWVRCLQEKKKKPFSCQVKSHGRLTEHSLYHSAWLESKHTWFNMHCPHVHREYIFCITSTQSNGVLLNDSCNTGRAIVCK